MDYLEALEDLIDENPPEDVDQADEWLAALLSQATLAVCNLSGLDFSQGEATLEAVESIDQSFADCVWLCIPEADENEEFDFESVLARITGKVMLKCETICEDPDTTPEDAQLIRNTVLHAFAQSYVLSAMRMLYGDKLQQISADQYLSFAQPLLPELLDVLKRHLTSFTPVFDEENCE